MDCTHHRKYGRFQIKPKPAVSTLKEGRRAHELLRASRRIGRGYLCTCGKALCHQCARQAPDGLVCRLSCARRSDACRPEDAETVRQMQIQLSRIVVVTFGVLIMALGVLFCLSRTTWTDWLLCSAGMLLTLLGARNPGMDAFGSS